MPMTLTRRHELEGNPGLQLTDQEVAEGYRFCMCEWDGLLIQEGDPEAKFCGCWFDKEGRLVVK